MATVRKNGKAYDSGDVTCTLLGELETEVKEVGYETDQDHQLNYSLSNSATSWSRGKIMPTGSLTLYMNAARKLENVSNGDLLSIAPFDTFITFVNEFNDIITDKITWKFKKVGRQVNGEMGLAYQYEMFCLGIEYNIK